MTAKRAEKRRQCAKCPWKVTTDPHDIPNGYCETKHARLEGTISKEPGDNMLGGELRIMACHEEHEVPCVGWLANQLGPGNNLGLRIACARGRFNANVELVGKQHERFEDTLPRTGKTKGSK